jgi:acyl-coenzyme A thioesterase 13
MSEGRSSLDWQTADTTPGNATRGAKQVVHKWLDAFTSRGTGFGDSVGRRVKLTDISVNQMPNEPERLEGRVDAEITITEGACKSGYS